MNNGNLNLKRNTFFVFFLVVFFLILDFVMALESAYGPEIQRDNYIISRSKVERVVSEGDVFRDYLVISNLRSQDIEVSFSISDGISRIIEFESVGVVVGGENSSTISFFVRGAEPKNYSGSITLQGDIKEKLPVNITVLEEFLNAPVLLETELLKQKFTLNSFLEFKLNVNKLKPEEIKNASFSYSITDEKNKSYLLESEIKNISSSFQVIKKFEFPEALEAGSYVLEIVLEDENKVIINKSSFLLKESFFSMLLFGFLPVWLLVLIGGLAVIGFIIFYVVRKIIEKRKKYQMKLDVKTIPKKNPDFLFLGKVAETNVPSYLDPAMLMTHSIVAGATGGGKSISAQVIIEEALLHNIAVIVFDPTAQWSGMLRKCEDKKMFSYYPKFGLKETDAKAFKGNVRQVKNARELIDMNKYMNPGQIQIFTLNKLDPKDIDLFVSNIIRQIFKFNPVESPTLKTIVIFDEVHRLLSRFGGSGEGFLQVERACREFRKWGIGVMLVSQVLSDFVGEIKANISTELQMRTRDEGDLNRIKEKYGTDFLQSLVKASVGVGMFVNPSYNHARPYFINFRPILHNTRRLSDEELERYNKYNIIVDDLEYQIEQLEKEKIDTFDLKMELKLVKDKVMTGNFSVVEIYLEGLKPRVEKEWEKLGKKPKKREIQLVAEEEIRESIEEAKKSREKWEKEEAKKAPKEGEKKEEVKLEEKEVKPLTFDNGIMVSSLKELKGVLPEFDPEIFKIHVNEKKNDVADWAVSISPELGEKLKGVKDKQELIDAIAAFEKGGAEKPAEKKEAKKEVKKGKEEKKEVEKGKKPEETKEPKEEGEEEATEGKLETPKEGEKPEEEKAEEPEAKKEETEEKPKQAKPELKKTKVKKAVKKPKAKPKRVKKDKKKGKVKPKKKN